MTALPSDLPPTRSKLSSIKEKVIHSACTALPSGGSLSGGRLAGCPASNTMKAAREHRLTIHISQHFGTNSKDSVTRRRKYLWTGRLRQEVRRKLRQWSPGYSEQGNGAFSLACAGTCATRSPRRREPSHVPLGAPSRGEVSRAGLAVAAWLRFDCTAPSSHTGR